MTAVHGCPAVTAEQMREVDRAMVEDFHIELMQMMENAGRGVAELAVDAFVPRRVLVLAGPGGNGGGGLVAARHLAHRGRDVCVVLATPATQLGAVPAPVLSLDTPSGLDVTTGVPARPGVRVTATLTLALPKTGLLCAREAGRLYLADISVPPLLYRRMGIEVGDLFSTGPIIALDGVA